jgi:hypothetical protein
MYVCVCTDFNACFADESKTAAATHAADNETVEKQTTVDTLLESEDDTSEDLIPGATGSMMSSATLTAGVRVRDVGDMSGMVGEPSFELTKEQVCVCVCGCACVCVCVCVYIFTRTYKYSNFSEK